MRKFFVLANVLCLLISLEELRSQETAHQLDPITLTASLAPEKASRTGRNVFVIKGEKFSQLPVHSIDECLRYLPGVEIQSRGPLGAQSDIVLRGGTFQQVLVILDGVRINDPNTGHFSGYIPIVPSEIERVEILKGASSAIYGSEAVGGVIHIITKTFALKKGKANSVFSAQVTGGEYNLFSLNAGGYFSNGTTALSAGILSNNTTGQPQRGTNGFVYAHTASFSLAHYFNERFELKMRYSYDDRKFGAQNFYTNFISDTAKERVSTFWNQLGLVYHANRHKLGFNIGYKNLEDEYQYNSVGLPNKSTSKMLQAMLTEEWKIQPRTTIITGVQFISKRIMSNDRGRHHVNQAAVFSVVNQQFGENFFASPALRLEWNERTGLELIPQVNLSYRMDHLQLRASAGKTIRDADFTERFNNYNKVFVSGGRIGNPDLSPEHSVSYEAGADYFVNDNLKISGTFFQRYHTRLIDYVTTAFADMPRKVNLSPTGTYALAKNIAKVNTTGLETDIQWMKDIDKEHSISATAGLVWLLSSSSALTPSFYISSHARFLANFNLLYRINKFRLAINGIYKKRDEQIASVTIAKVSPHYFMMNVKAESLIWADKLTVFIEADNVFDSNYADLLGAQMPGRWLMGGIKISL